MFRNIIRHINRYLSVRLLNKSKTVMLDQEDFLYCEKSDFFFSMEIRVWDQNVHNCNATHTAPHVKRVLAQAHLVLLMKPLIICA